MNNQTIELFINIICNQLDEKIQQEHDLPHDYIRKLKRSPGLIKAQAKASLKTIENRTGLNLLVTVLFTQEFLKHMKELDQAYAICSSSERLIISQKQLAPFQISLLAKHLALAPGIIKQYEDIKNNN